MKTKLILFFLIVFFCSCNTNTKQDKQVIEELDNTIVGIWVRIRH